MNYLGWAVLYEGPTDSAYFDILIPRMMEEIVALRGVGHAEIPSGPAVVLHRGPVDAIAKEACDARQAFQLVFIHSDTGGRNLQAGMDARSNAYCLAMADLCGWPAARCITISPRHETEAWVLADPQAVTEALGYRGLPASIGLPVNAADAETLPDPKAVLAEAVGRVRGRRRQIDVKQIFAAIAQRQSLVSLRQAPSFAAFEAALLAGLADLGSVRAS